MSVLFAKLYFPETGVSEKGDPDISPIPRPMSI